MEAARCMGVSSRAVRKAIKTGRFKVKSVVGNGGPQYLLLLDSLPAKAQSAYYAAKLAPALTPEARHDAARATNASILEQARKTAAEGGMIGKLELDPVPIVDHTEREALWAEFERASTGHQDKARRDFDILCAYSDLERAGVSKGEIIGQLRRKFSKGVSEASVWRLRQIVRGQGRGVWLPLLLPRWKGKTACAAFSEEAWVWIKAEWGSLSKPALAPIYRRAVELGRAKGWQIPSLDTVQARIDALPEWERVLLREGTEAMSRLYPAQRRDYTTLRLHEMWCSDGRKADVFCRWEDGEISRPIIVGWIELRSRVCCGYEVGKTESADLIRLAFKRAAETTKALPDAALMDNGRGFASKLLTGRVPNRYRFKVKEEDILGILPSMGVEVCWATPGHGQAKPIESWWKTLAEMEKRSEFQGAYCGNRPDAKPEDFDASKAVPIELYKRILAEEIAAYHARSHRGSGMDGKSPHQVYEALLPGVAPKQPTKAQLRFCLLAAEAVKLDKRDGSVWILGNRYWSEPLAELRRDRPYTVRFNSVDAKEPVVVLDGARIICEALLLQAVGFRDQPAAKEHARARAQFLKSRKQMTQAAGRMARAESWMPGAESGLDAEETAAQPGLPSPKVVTMLRPEIAAPARRAEPLNDDEGDLGLTDEEIDRLLAAGRARRRAGD